MKKCLFSKCRKVVSDNRHFCFAHWKELSPDQKRRFHAAWDAYAVRQIDEQELRRRQREVLSEVQGVIR